MIFQLILCFVPLTLIPVQLTSLTFRRTTSNNNTYGTYINCSGTKINLVRLLLFLVPLKFLTLTLSVRG